MLKYGNNNIGKIFYGSNAIAKIYYGSNLVFQSGVQPTPTVLPYIRGGANGSYIDTGITADNTVKIILWARNWNPTSGTIFGSRVGTTSNTYGIGTHGAGNTGKIRLDYGQSNSTYANDQFSNLSHYHKYEFYQGALKVDDVTVATATASTFSNNLNIYLFGLNNNGSFADMMLPVDICSVKIYKNNILVRDYAPVNSPSIGLYDSVSNTLFTNAGSGTFTYGTFDRDSYQPLDYIASQGSQYFDTGIKGSNAMPFVVKYMTTGSENWPNLFGGKTSNSSKRYGVAFGTNTNKYKEFYLEYNANISTYTSPSSMNNSIYVANKTNANSMTLYQSSSSGLTLKSTLTPTAATFTCDYNIYVGGVNSAGNAGSFCSAKYYFLGFGSNRNFVPAKVNNVAGMYDTYNDVFYQSASGTAFVAGSEI